MYKEFFGLSEAPFSISPNPRFFYLSRHHREALASLKHGTAESGGFVLFTGEVGTGKTVIVRTMIQQFPPEIVYAAIYNPDLSINELLEAVCQGFGISFTAGSSKRELLDKINNFLLECAQKGKRAVLLIDEAQHLSDEVLEQVRLLTNFETNNTKLLQVVLIGQPELTEKLRQQHLRQLAQRITARFHLLPLTVTEVDSYVRFRLQSAGCLQVIFTRGAIEKLFGYSKGIPRIINVIADRALLAAYVDHSHTVEARHVRKAAREVLGLDTLSNTVGRRLREGFLFSFLGRCAALVVAGGILGSSLGYLYSFTDNVSERTKVIDILKNDAELTQAREDYKKVRTAAVSDITLKKERTRYEADVLNSTMEENAWRSLVREWGFADTGEGSGDINNSCMLINSHGFRCLAAKGSLSELERYNIPAVLQLMDDNLTPYYAVLLALDKTYAVLLLNGREWIVERKWLENAMEGDFRLLWPLPGGEEMVKSTSSRTSQKLVAQMLANRTGDADYVFNGWNAGLTQKIKDVQAENGLRVDGIAGVDTLWVLLPYADTGHALKRDKIEPIGEIRQVNVNKAVSTANSGSDTDMSASDNQSDDASSDDDDKISDMISLDGTDDKNSLKANGNDDEDDTVYQDGSDEKPDMADALADVSSQLGDDSLDQGVMAKDTVEEIDNKAKTEVTKAKKNKVSSGLKGNNNKSASKTKTDISIDDLM